MPSKIREAEPLSSAAIRSQLERVLASPHLCQSKRCQALLKHVVEAHLEGCPEKVKERCIGFEVFQRDADYDTSHDSIVRTTAAEVRKRLAQYYLEPEHEHELRIVLPLGSYSPQFRVAARFAAAPVPLTARRRHRSLWIALPAAVLIGAAAVAAYAIFRPTEMDLFWKPLFQARSEAVMCIEQPVRIFRFMGPRTDELNEEMVGDQQAPPATEEVRERTHVKLSELEPTGQNFFPYGDVIATTRIAGMFARSGKPCEVLGDRITAYRDLRGRPVVLLGQFNNQWTLGLTGSLRYYLDKDTVLHQYHIRDRQQHGKVIASVPKDRREEDLAIISRIFDVTTEEAVVAVVGSTSLGTLAAGDFLTDTTYMSQAFRDAPSGWYRKNIQVVLKVPTVRGTAGPPHVMLTYFW